MSNRIRVAETVSGPEVRPRASDAGLRRAVVAAAAVATAWLVAVSVGIALGRLVLPGLDGRTLSLAVLVGVSAVIVIAITLLRWWHVLGFIRPWRNRWVLVLPLGIVLAPWIGGFNATDVSAVALLVVGYALTGFAEETVFRGVMLRILGPMTVRRAVLLSAVLFGLVHFGNLLIRDSPAIVAAQAVGAMTAGVGYAAIYVLTQSIWPVIGIHFLHDLVLNTSAWPLIPVDVVQDVLLVGYGIYLLWFRAEGRDAPNPAAVIGPSRVVIHEPDSRVATKL
jgi:membrane protease YdiL (CAAX protease family)